VGMMANMLAVLYMISLLLLPPLLPPPPDFGTTLALQTCRALSRIVTNRYAPPACVRVRVCVQACIATSK
jgi:hypothetical protein